MIRCYASLNLQSKWHSSSNFCILLIAILRVTCQISPSCQIIGFSCLLHILVLHLQLALLAAIKIIRIDTWAPPTQSSLDAINYQFGTHTFSLRRSSLHQTCQYLCSLQESHHHTMKICSSPTHTCETFLTHANTSSLTFSGCSQNVEWPSPGSVWYSTLPKFDFMNCSCLAAIINWSSDPWMHKTGKVLDTDIRARSSWVRENEWVRTNGCCGGDYTSE